MIVLRELQFVFRDNKHCQGHQSNWNSGNNAFSHGETCFGIWCPYKWLLKNAFILKYDRFIRCCKDSTENSYIPFVQFPPVVAS